MAIHAIVGLPGMGKTLYGVHMLRRVKGRRRISNLFPKSGEWEFGLWDEMINTGHATALIDEAHMWFGSRGWDKTKQADLMPWQQHRKQGLDLWYTVQSINRVDVAVRELTAYMHMVRKFGNVIMDTIYFPEELQGPKPKPFRRRIVHITKADYDAYWTEQLVGDRDGMGYDLGRLAGSPEEAPRYAKRRGVLSGPELRYCEPSHVVVRCLERSERIPWLSHMEVIAKLREFAELGFTLVALPYALEFQLETVREPVRWSLMDWVRSGDPRPAAILAEWESVRCVVMHPRRAA